MQLIPFTTWGSRREFPVYTGNSSRRASIKLNRCQGGMPAAVAVVRGGGERLGNNTRRHLLHKAWRVGRGLPASRDPTLSFVWAHCLPCSWMTGVDTCHPTLSERLFVWLLHMHQCFWPLLLGIHWATLEREAGKPGGEKNNNNDDDKKPTKLTGPPRCTVSLHTLSDVRMVMPLSLIKSATDET